MSKKQELTGMLRSLDERLDDPTLKVDRPKEPQTRGSKKNKRRKGVRASRKQNRSSKKKGKGNK